MTLATLAVRAQEDQKAVREIVDRAVKAAGGEKKLNGIGAFTLKVKGQIAVNDQKIDSLVLTSNDFGSIQGNFRLPSNLLNGEFRLRDEKTKDEMAFSVEEYKRPTFYIAYDTVKGSWKAGDSIRIKGSTLAYSGNTIDGAKMSWRILRESYFPYPWLFKFYPSVSEEEIAHGVCERHRDGLPSAAPSVRSQVG
jgi:hypothetical protein